jgi:hypothetical protein
MRTGRTPTSLEAFYLGLLTVQLKGVYLVIDARKANDQDALARQFVVDFYNDMLVPQTDLYLSTVEQLTLHYIDLRWSQSLPDVHDNYLSRADYLAQELRNGLNPDALLAGTLDTSERLVLTARIMTQGNPAAISNISFNGPASVQAQRVSAVTVQADNLPFSIVRYVARGVIPGAYSLNGVHALYQNYPVQVASGGTTSSLTVAAWLPTPDTMYRVDNKNSGKSLEFAGPTRDEGAHVQLWDEDGSPGQRWSFIDGGLTLGALLSTLAPVQMYGFRNVYGSTGGQHTLVLDVGGFGRSSGTPVILWGWHQGDNQLWMVRTHTGAYGVSPTNRDFRFAVRAMHSPTTGVNALFLGTANNATFNGANAVIWSDNFFRSLPDNRWWKFERQSDGTVIIRHVNSNKVLEAVGSSTLNGARLQQFPWRDANIQK